MRLLNDSTAFDSIHHVGNVMEWTYVPFFMAFIHAPSYYLSRNVFGIS